MNPISGFDIVKNDCPSGAVFFFKTKIVSQIQKGMIDKLKIKKFLNSFLKRKNNNIAAYTVKANSLVRSAKLRNILEITYSFLSKKYIDAIINNIIRGSVKFLNIAIKNPTLIAQSRASNGLALYFLKNNNKMQQERIAEAKFINNIIIGNICFTPRENTTVNIG